MNQELLLDTRVSDKRVNHLLERADAMTRKLSGGRGVHLDSHRHRQHSL